MNKNECSKCHQKPNGNGIVWKVMFAMAALSLGSLSFVNAGIQEDMKEIKGEFDKLDEILQREIDLADTALIKEIESLQKQIDQGFKIQVSNLKLLIERINMNDDWIRDHIENHP